MLTVYVPMDSAAVALGADDIAATISAWCAARQQPLNLVRNGSRGLLWLEPLVEVATERGRIGYAAVAPENIADLLQQGLLVGADLPQCIGLVDELPYLKQQERLCFARIGQAAPTDIQAYECLGGWAGLRLALAMAPADIVQTVTDSGLRGRGGAAFPTGIKWRTVQLQAASAKYIVCNADEGDSGTFADRLIMESDPFVLIEGMIIAGLAVGARTGIIYVRAEYPHAIACLRQAIDVARGAGYLGERIGGSEHDFDLSVREAAGAYICGEETALLESIEGKRGLVRAKPPLPAIQGLFGAPTVINNVLTLASVPIVLARGAAFYRDYGMGRSLGTMPFQLAGNIRYGGLVEKAFGITLRQLVEDFGGGTRTGRPIKAIQVGGPLGSYIPPSQWDEPLDYERYAQMGAVLGHGGIVVHDDTVDMHAMARYAMHFCAVESCGKCTPCRIGSTRGMEVLDKMKSQPEQQAQQETLLRDLCDLMTQASLCAMGSMTPYPVLSALDHYPDDFQAASGASA